MATMIRVEEKDKKLNLLHLINFIVANAQGEKFTFYVGTSSHDEDYLEFRGIKYFALDDGDFVGEWISNTGERKQAWLEDFDELIYYIFGYEN